MGLSEKIVHVFPLRSGNTKVLIPTILPFLYFHYFFIVVFQKNFKINNINFENFLLYMFTENIQFFRNNNRECLEIVRERPRVLRQCENFFTYTLQKAWS